jgi:hypothetical protein
MFQDTKVTKVASVVLFTIKISIIWASFNCTVRQQTVDKNLLTDILNRYWLKWSYEYVIDQVRFKIIFFFPSETRLDITPPLDII